MDLDWSQQSPHIRSLFRPWQYGDGFADDVLAAAEARCGVRLPATLRSFYETWGRRRDLTQMNEHLFAPDEWLVHSNALIFCVENQGCSFWALPLASLTEADAPVVVAENELESAWEVTTGLVWRKSHQRVPAFLDDLTYRHAFAGGALHGAWSERTRLLPWQSEWLERNWGTATRTAWDLRYPENGSNGPGTPLYVREGQAVEWFDICAAAAQSEQALDEVAQALSIVWQRRW
jgi:hypothetical protein